MNMKATNPNHLRPTLTEWWNAPANVTEIVYNQLPLAIRQAGLTANHLRKLRTVKEYKTL